MPQRKQSFEYVLDTTNPEFGVLSRPELHRSLADATGSYYQASEAVQAAEKSIYAHEFEELQDARAKLEDLKKRVKELEKEHLDAHPVLYKALDDAREWQDQSKWVIQCLLTESRLRDIQEGVEPEASDLTLAESIQMADGQIAKVKLASSRWHPRWVVSDPLQLLEWLGEERRHMFKWSAVPAGKPNEFTSFFTTHLRAGDPIPSVQPNPVIMAGTKNADMLYFTNPDGPPTYTVKSVEVIIPEIENEEADDEPISPPATV